MDALGAFLTGLYPWLLMFPFIAIADEPNPYAIGGWGLLRLVLGLAIRQQSAAATATASPTQCITDGWRWISGAVGTALEDTITYDANLIGQPSPIQPGDFVLAVEGYPYAALLTNAQQGQRLYRANWQSIRAGAAASQGPVNRATLSWSPPTWAAGRFWRLLPKELPKA